MTINSDVSNAMNIGLDIGLPEMPDFVEHIRRAPDRGFRLTPAQAAVSLQNALRYIPERHHRRLMPEFMSELTQRGRIYGYRFRPPGEIKAQPIDHYEGNDWDDDTWDLILGFLEENL